MDAMTPRLFLQRPDALLRSLMLLLWSLTLALSFPGHASAEADYLAPEEAFQISARMEDARTIAIDYRIADGYYMYRERFHFDADNARLGAPVLPAGKVQYDETFGKELETYRKALTIRVPVEASGPFILAAGYQGCADAGLCYPPMTQKMQLTPTVLGTAGTVVTDAGAADDGSPNSASTETGRIEASLQSGRLLVVMPLFLLLGLGLAFTPCVLPMVPILSSIILGDKARATRSRGLLLSGAYSLGMAIVYTLLGVAAGLAGEGLAAALQNAWVLSAFAVLLVLLSLSMFGVYQLQMPAAIQNRLTQASGQQGAGKLTGVFLMGALSALIVGPCVAAPLAGALVYISHTRDVVVGGGALFAMAVGMSVPLLLIGASSGALLPRAGAWMEEVKRFFGVLMLGTAWWMVSPILPGAVEMGGWAALGLGYAGTLLWSARGRWTPRILALLFAALGALQLAGVATGGRDAWSPLAHLDADQVAPVSFQRVASVAELDAALAATDKPVMLDFYADWCVSCKEMEKFTFTDGRVRQELDQMLLLQADVTANNADDKALLKRFQLFGPPGIIFFDDEGHELREVRVIGFQDSDRFVRVLKQARGS